MLNFIINFMQSFIFLFPWLLLAFLILPFLWRFLRLNPPQPKKEIFPYFYLLQDLKDNKKKPQSIPLWLLLLRLFLISLLILIFAHPILRQKPIIYSKNADIVLIFDNSWAMQKYWQQTLDKAQNLLEDARKQNKKVFIIPTLSYENENNRFYTELSAEGAEKYLRSLKIYPASPNRFESFKKLSENPKLNILPLDIFYFSDGLKTDQDEKAFSALKKLNIQKFFITQVKMQNHHALIQVEQKEGSFIAHLIRTKKHPKEDVSLSAYNKDGQKIAQSKAIFLNGQTSSQARFSVPLEIRNHISFIKIDNQNDAASLFLLGNNYQRKRIALLSPPLQELFQPLLSPFYYITKALEDKSNLIYASNVNFSSAVKDLIQKNPSIIILDDKTNLPKGVENLLKNFINKGGMLIRFAGPHFSHKIQEEDLLPVKLRPRIYSSGGVLSATQPKKIKEFSKNSPFLALKIPEKVEIYRQVLAEPSSDLQEKTWIALNDGTPLVTIKTFGKGRILFIHTSLDPEWSNLSLDGFFVDMLQKISETVAQEQDNFLPLDNTKPLKPWRILTADGHFALPEHGEQALTQQDLHHTRPSLIHPAGFYGMKNTLFALNLFDKKTKIEALSLTNFPKAKIYAGDKQIRKDFLPFLALSVFIIFLLDSAIALKDNNLRFLNFTKIFKKSFFLLFFFCLILFLPYTKSMIVCADTSEKANIKAAGQTHLAYIKTEDQALNATIDSGLKALSKFISDRTTVQLGDVIALDIETDTLAFYPLIYWPIRAEQKEPSEKAFDKINFYMQHGGTILFDTADQMEKNMRLEQEEPTKASEKLKAILSYLDVPALEKVTKKNVIAHSYYIMPNFPGLYSQSPLWTCVSTDSNEKTENDGVSPILITANDLASAWARDEDGDNYIYPLVMSMPRQRLWAFRGGLNIVMYVLTGNYKADQLHIPALLERLGNEKNYKQDEN